MLCPRAVLAAAELLVRQQIKTDGVGEGERYKNRER